MGEIKQAQSVTYRLIEPHENDKRLDRFIQQAYPHVPFGALQRVIRSGQVRVDGKRVKANMRLKAGQMLRLPPFGQPVVKKAEKTCQSHQDFHKKLQEVKENILMMDEDLLVLNKPAHLPVQGGSKVHLHLDGMLDELMFDAKERPRLVHRLDKETSGVLLLARHAQAAAFLTGAFKEKKVQKLYWALTIKGPDEKKGYIDAPLFKGLMDGVEKVRVCQNQGKKAQTLFHVHGYRQGLCWMSLAPVTGRTHQLRVHCAHEGFPILGDGKYAGKLAFKPAHEPFVHLHAACMEFPHPSTQKPLMIQAPLRGHMAKSFQILKFFPHEKNAKLLHLPEKYQRGS